MYNFSINVLKTVTRLTPPFLRRAFFIAWLKAFTTPIKTLNSSLVDFVADRREELTYNGQTIQLERLLNDKFDDVSRRISIIHSTSPYVFDYLNAEAQTPDYDYLVSEAHVPQEFLAYFYELGVSLIDGFEVHSPASLTSESDKIESYVLRYKIAGVNYALIFT